MKTQKYFVLKLKGQKKKAKIGERKTKKYKQKKNHRII